MLSPCGCRSLATHKHVARQHVSAPHWARLGAKTRPVETRPKRTLDDYLLLIIVLRSHEIQYCWGDDFECCHLQTFVTNGAAAGSPP